MRLLIGTMLRVCILTVGVADNLIVNGGFEDYPSQWQSPYAWAEWCDEWWDPGVSASYTGTKDSRTGNRHLIHQRGSDYRAYTYERVNSLPLGIYTAEAHVRSSGGQKLCGLIVKFGNSEKWVPVSASGTWQRVVTSFDIRHGFIEIGFWSDAKSGQYLHVDDAEVYYGPPKEKNIDLTGYTLIFEDNFDSLSVSENQWDKGDKTWFFWPPYGASGAYSASHWTSWVMHCRDGVLHNSATYDESLNSWTNWRTGNLSSTDRSGNGFFTTYGYFSARVKMPNAGRGAWPAFWLFSKSSVPNNQGRRLEVDIFEWYGNNPAQVGQSVHCWESDGSQGPLSGGGWADIPGGDAINEWHVYGCQIDPTNITFYIDGEETRKMPTPTDYLGPMYLMIDYALGGGWPVDGEPFASKGSSTMLVDWVRVYSLPRNFDTSPNSNGFVENSGFEADADDASAAE